MTASAAPAVRLPTWSFLLIFALLGLAACGGTETTPPAAQPAETEQPEEDGTTAEPPADDPTPEDSDTGDELGGSLVIGSWGGVIDEATTDHYTDAFTEETGVDVTFDAAPSTFLARVEAMADAGRMEWDVMDSVSGDAAWALHERGLLEPLPADLKAEFEEILGAERVTDFGFTHANLGHVIVCNKDTMQTCPQSWEEFYDTEAFPEARMFGAVKHLFMAATAQLAAGMSPTEITSSPVDLDLVFEQFERIRPSVRVFYTDSDQQQAAIRGGEVDMGPMTTGRAFQLVEEGMNLEIVWNEAVYEPSYWAVPAGTENAEAAFALMAWIARNAEAQAQWAEALRYSVPNPEASQHISAEVAEQLIDTPANAASAVIPNLGWFATNGDELLTRYEDFLRG